MKNNKTRVDISDSDCKSRRYASVEENKFPELKHLTVMPTNLEVKIGRLRIVNDAGTVTTARGTKLYIDDVPVSFTEFNLRMNVNEPITASISFYPQSRTAEPKERTYIPPLGGSIEIDGTVIKDVVSVSLNECET